MLERLLEHRGRLAAGSDEDDRRAGLLADRGHLLGGEHLRPRGVDHAVEMSTRQRGCRSGDLLARADDIDLLAVDERGLERLVPVAVTGEVDADHRPPPRTVLSVSIRSELSAAFRTGRSSSVQSAFRRTKKSRCTCVSETARITDVDPLDCESLVSADPVRTLRSRSTIRVAALFARCRFATRWTWSPA